MTLTRRAQGAFLLFCCLLFTSVVVRTAWVNDDAYITFRTVDNLVNGLGLTWNPVERVQAYTHPLWLFLLAAVYPWTRELYFTSLALSIALSLATALTLAFRLATSTAAALLGVLLLTSSKAFTDFSTSGLENPLTHLILVVFLVIYFRAPLTPRTLFALALVAALGLLNRTDLFLLVAAPLAQAVIRLRTRAAAGALLAGLTPFALWELFSLWYYGFLFPNTAYAKLNTGLPQAALIEQGFYYLLSTVKLDPLTLVVIGAGLLAPLITRDWKGGMVALGIALYLVYVIRIGGDFMSGRFFAAPFLCAVVLLLCLELPALEQILAAGLALALGLTAPYPPLLSGETFAANRPYLEIKDPNGVADERGIYYQATGLLRASRERQLPVSQQADEGRQLRAKGPAVVLGSSIGFVGFYAGPEVFIVDIFALSDPLLARLPASENDEWRIGHFKRVIPYGYVDTLTSGQSKLRDKSLALYYEKLTVITRGDLFDPGRLVEIWRVNTGAYNHLIDFDTYRFADARLRRNRA